MQVSLTDPQREVLVEGEGVDDRLPHPHQRPAPPRRTEPDDVEPRFPGQQPQRFGSRVEATPRLERSPVLASEPRGRCCRGLRPSSSRRPFGRRRASASSSCEASSARQAGSEAQAAVLAALEERRPGWRVQLDPAVERLPAGRAFPAAVDKFHYCEPEGASYSTPADRSESRMVGWVKGLRRGQCSPPVVSLRGAAKRALHRGPGGSGRRGPIRSRSRASSPCRVAPRRRSRTGSFGGSPCWAPRASAVSAPPGRAGSGCGGRAGRGPWRATRPRAGERHPRLTRSASSSPSGVSTCFGTVMCSPAG